jgi:hypothetical protein
MPLPLLSGIETVEEDFLYWKQNYKKVRGIG